MTDLLALHAVPDLRPAAGGIAATLPPLCSALRDEGVESHVVVLAQDELVPAQVPLTVLAERSPWALKRRLHSEVLHFHDTARRSGRGFVCHSHGIWSLLNHGLVAAANTVHAPLVISLHGMLLPWARGHKAWRKAIAWRLYQARDFSGSAIVHVTSEAEQREAEIAGVLGPFAVIPFGTNLPTHGGTVSDEVEFAQRSTREPRTLLFLGRVHPIKNIDSLVKAFALARLSNWRLRIVGPDEVGYHDKLKQLARVEGVADRVSIEGPMFGAEKSRLLAQSDLLVLPSHSENFGSVVAEALAHGTPAIASVGTPWSALKCQGCGWWSEPDPISLAEAIRAAANLPPDRRPAWPGCARG